MASAGDDVRRVSAGRRYPGVHFRVGADGVRRYEVSWTDAEGRRRRKAIGPSLEEAVAAREELRGRARRGERVGSSRLRFAEVVDRYFESATTLRPRTYEKYEGSLRLHVTPVLGRRPVASISEDDVAALIRRMGRRGLAPATIQGTLVPLSRVFSYAVRRGLAARNPVGALERGERPSIVRRDLVVLSRDEIGALLAASSERWRLVFATAVFCGLRLSELLALRWGDVDPAEGVLRVRWQLARRRRAEDGSVVAAELVEPKTASARRAVVLMPALAKLLREARLAAPPSRSGDESFVFAAASGRPVDPANVARELERALGRAGVRRRITMHALRHTFASLLIAGGADVVFVSRQLGHASPKITLDRYAHRFDGVVHAERTRAMLEAGFGTTLVPGDGGGRRLTADPAPATVTELPASAVDGGS